MDTHGKTKRTIVVTAVLAGAMALCGATGVPQEKTNPFEVAGVDDPETVYAFLGTLQKAVAADEAKEVAGLSRLPIEVSFEGARERVTSRARLEQLYPRIFSACLKRVVAAATPESLFANWQGVMLGSGAVWFGPDEQGVLQLTAINGPIAGEELCKAP